MAVRVDWIPRWINGQHVPSWEMVGFLVGFLASLFRSTSYGGVVSLSIKDYIPLSSAKEVRMAVYPKIEKEFSQLSKGNSRGITLSVCEKIYN